MPNYSVVGPSVNFSDGVLELSEEQYSARAHNLEDLGKGRYKIINTVQFKHGEVVGYEGEVNKTLLSLIEEEGKKEPSKVEKLLKGNVKAVEEALSELTDDELQEVLKLDKRKGVLDAASALIEERASTAKLETLLKGDEEAIEKELPNLSDDELLKVIELEEAGENRKGVLDGVNAVIEARDND